MPRVPKYSMAAKCQSQQEAAEVPAHMWEEAKGDQRLQDVLAGRITPEQYIKEETLKQEAIKREMAQHQEAYQELTMALSSAQKQHSDLEAENLELLRALGDFDTNICIEVLRDNDTNICIEGPTADYKPTPQNAPAMQGNPRNRRRRQARRASAAVAA
mmetsp:Transcript_91062/g.253545  ORF Transcript_91062/g.253545 Transcript_91062/m.253545 type:complete len:159 (+) Transcript_91062:82-558(+)|eukprot:CAMPEP_0179163612 /NCGR_PEP_ID=MMETSP0796-20121207/80236_1 /TAXON_ID=73915 /ORGANISM="Pyrodinium bahamense, Strain pbaha01" /LENGTH=158 /DNA_ID=CAMNT_0020865961 /DNA_START=40 /DNA_END=516 /DNA_ORIENTATION=+